MKSLQYIILTLIQPFFALCAYIFNLHRKVPTNTDIILTTAIVSILGIYWYPWGDPQTHFAIYYADIVHRFYSFSIFNSNYLYDYILTIIAKIFGNFVWGYFFWIFVPLLLFNISIWKFGSRHKVYAYIFFALLLFIGNRETLDLNRNTAAALLFATALLNNERKIFFVILVIIASLIHSTILIVLIAGLLIMYFPFKLSKKFAIIITIASYATSFISSVALSYFLDDKIVAMYIEGAAGAGITVPSGFFYLMTIVNIIILIVVFLLIIKSYNLISHNLLFSCYASSLLITFMTWYLWTMRERFMLVNIILGFSLIIYNWSNLNRNGFFSRLKTLKYIITLSIFRLLFVFMVEYSSELIHNTGSLNPEKTFSIVSRSFYLPTPFLLNIDEFGFNDYYYQKLFYRTQEVIKAHRY